ncbi:MAG TPA: lipoprotein-releasing ABC transporter permease subunit [Methylophilaceae bacterium]
MSSYEFFIGLRYTRAKRRNHFISFISMTSMIGIALGVAALIVVLSVMNGFQHELRTRILGVASHIQITGSNNMLSDWPGMVKFVQGSKQVKGAAPYIVEQGMLSLDQAVQGTIVRGILPAEENRVADIGSQMKAGKLSNLKSGEFGIVLGMELAQSLGAGMGDKVVLMAPQGQFTPAGIVPRIKQFTVVGIFQVGMYEYDASLALIHMDDAAKLYRMGNQVSGVRLKLENLDDAPEIARDLAKQLTAGAYYVSDWTVEHANFFRAVRMEKRVMFVILTLIVAVAAFNIVSTLVMAVTDKRADIAILRTLGASPRSIMKIFIVQGAAIGFIGTALGAVGGVILALNISTVVPFIENLFGVHFLPKEVYYISELPSQLQSGDVITITLVSLVLSLLATLYPSWRASNTNPVEALRYE